MSTRPDNGYLVFCGIAPHPPIMVPEVGGEAIAEVRNSITAMAEFTSRVVAAGAETVVIISPHAPLEPDSFVVYSGPTLKGDFSQFRAPQTSFLVEVDLELQELITRNAAEKNFRVTSVSDLRVDHGTAVPLYFLLQHGWHGKVVALGFSFLPDQDHLAFGKSIRTAVGQSERRVAFVASGDLSHRLKPEAPAGYNPTAHLFDEQVVAALRANAPQQIAEVNREIRTLAGECGYRSILVALGAIAESTSSCELLSYEAPFGVGYLVAQLFWSLATVASEPRVDDLPRLAREAVEAFVLNSDVLQPASGGTGLLDQPAPCFVCLKTVDGELRGCVGTIEASQGSLAEEIVANAISAATRDPRFEPVGAHELSQLHYSVDVLGAAEPATIKDLDPTIYGVIVEDALGERRGLLLPDIEGIETAEQQIEIAARKAGIARGEKLRLFRFQVQRFSEV